MILTIQLFIDFVQGTGFFRGDQDAWEIVRKMSKHKRRNLERCGIVPVDFFLYLAIKSIIRRLDLPEKAVSLTEFLDFLWHYPYQSKEAKAMGWYFRREILKSYLLFPPGPFGESGYVWAKMQEARNLGCSKRGNKATIK